MRTSEASGVAGGGAAVDEAGAAGMAPLDGAGGDAGSAGTSPSWLVGRRVLDSTGDSLGISVAAYADEVSGQPTWMAVYTGRGAAPIVDVPVVGSSLLGDDVIIAHELDRIPAAPGDPPTARHPTRQERLPPTLRWRVPRAHPSRGTSSTGVKALRSGDAEPV